jgi:hypothetical protein
MIQDARDYDFSPGARPIMHNTMHGVVFWAYRTGWRSWASTENVLLIASWLLVDFDPHNCLRTMFDV